MSSLNHNAADAKPADSGPPESSIPEARAEAAKPLCTSVAECMDAYFRTLNGHAPKTLNLYDTVLEQVEPPLLRATLDYCDGNQSRAAELLGLNRATLRKKLIQYGISTR